MTAERPLLLRTSIVLGLVLACALASWSCSRRLPTSPSAWNELHTRNAALSADSDSTDDADAEVMVTLSPGVDPVAFGAEYGATLTESNASGDATYRPASGEVPADLAARMGADPRVISSEPNGYLETAESRQQSFAFDDGRGIPQVYATQPATDAIGLEIAQRGSRGRGVLVAILDTGAELTHPALAGRIAGGWDFVSNDADPTDQPDGVDNDLDGYIDEARGHGTHVAGIVARTAPDARLLMVRVLDADGRGDMLSVASGIRWAMDQGARVINMSLGMMRPSAAIENMLEEAEARGIVVVASAGNWGEDNPVEFPASSEHAIAVAAVDNTGIAASFTSHGSFVGLSAPGVAICSAYYGGRYMLWSGTSMSAPFVSGTAGLLLAVHPHWGRQQILGRLSASARTLDELNPDIAGELGAGGLDAASALAPDFSGGSGPGDLTPGPVLRRP